MSNDGQACETPLIELLERVPADAWAWYEHDSTSHSHIPYGKHCREAAVLLRQQAEENARLERAYAELQVSHEEQRKTLYAANKRIRELEDRLAERRND